MGRTADLLKSESGEVIEIVDARTAKRYWVVEEIIDLDALRREKEALETQLAEKEPSEEELIELGKGMYPHIYDEYHRQSILDRIKKIDNVLGK